MKIINNWFLTAQNYNPYIAPELLKMCLGGVVSDKDIITSSIVGKRNGSVVTRSGSEYILGTPSEEYESAFPDSINRLLNQLSEV